MNKPITEKDKWGFREIVKLSTLHLSDGYVKPGMERQNEGLHCSVQAFYLLNNISPWLRVITVSSDHKKENSPLPAAAVAGCLVACLVEMFGRDPHSHGTADLLWLPAPGPSCASKG